MADELGTPIAYTNNLQLKRMCDDDVFNITDFDDNFVKIDNAHVDYIVEIGTNDFWYWRKWNSGRCELWGTSAHTYIDTWYAYGNAAYVELGSPAFPFTVTDPHIISIQPMVKPNEGELSYGLYYAMPKQGSNNNVITFDFVTAKSDDIFSGIIRYNVVGWWK